MTVASAVQIAFLEYAASVVEGAELDRDAGANTDQGSESALVEREGPFVLENGAGTGDGAGVFGGGLEADLDYVEGLAWSALVS